MKLYINDDKDFVFEGSGKEFKQLLKPLMNHSTTIPSFIKSPKILQFFQTLIHISNQDTYQTERVVVEESVVKWYFHVISLVPMALEEKLLQELHSHYEILHGANGVRKETLLDTLTLHYQDVLGVSTIKKIAGFLQSFELSEEQLKDLVISKFIESHPGIKVEDIQLHMLERMYQAFFDSYQSLMIESHLLYSFPLFKEQLIELYNKKNITVEESSFLWSYLLYFDMFISSLEDGYIYNAEDKEEIFEWFEPLFMKVAQVKVPAKEKIKERQNEAKEKEMYRFRELYIQILSSIFKDVIKIEEDKEIPYNVVFVLNGNRRIVSNTLKHYENYLDEVKSVRKEEIITMESFIKRIAPVSKANPLINTSLEEVEDTIFPMIRPIDSLPKEAVYTPFLEGVGIFYGICMKDTNRVQYAMIMTSLLDRWSINIEDIHVIAMKNLMSKPIELTTYYDVLMKQTPKESISSIPEVSKKILLLVGKSSIDSSFILDKNRLNQVKKELETDTLIISIPSNNFLIVSTKENQPIVEALSANIYEQTPEKLIPFLIEWKGNQWNIPGEK